MSLTDADDEQFQRELQFTLHGRRFIVALKQISVALNGLKSLRSYHVRNPWNEPAREREEQWQRTYVGASERARIAMDVLYKHYGWPLDGGYDETFIYAPKSRRSRTKP
jgi:hypothetical protein